MSHSDDQPMIQIRRLEKNIGGRSAIAIDALDLAAGEIVAVVGPMGSGKTLLIHLLTGLLPTSGGSILLDGSHLSPGQWQSRAQIGVLFEEDLLYERQSAHDNLAFSCRLRGLPVTSVGDALALVGLSDQAQTPAKKLNASAQRRLAFARALLGQPHLLLLDQPTLRVDLETQTLFARLLCQAAEAGALVVLTDEDLSWASTCCTRVVELEDGHIAQSYAFSASTDNAATETTNATNATSATPERFTPFKIPARKEDRVLLYDPGDILYASSRESKTYLRTANEEVIANCTLQELETRLSGRGFFKAHRAYLVNLQHVRAVIQYTRNSYLLQLDDAQETCIPLSRQSEKALQDVLGY